MSNPAPCKFSTACMRPDCYFSHPNGRAIDGSASMAGPSGATPAGHFPPLPYAPPPMPFMPHMEATPAGHFPPLPYAPPPTPFMPHMAPPPPQGKPQGAFGPTCRYGFECRRADCFFAHPEGRAIEAQQPRGYSGGARPRGNGGPKPKSLQGEASPSERDLGINLPDSPFGVDDNERLDLEQMMEAEDMAKDGVNQDGGDDWYPKYRDCSCCKGYIRACTAATCKSLGVCGCAFEDQDV